MAALANRTSMASLSPSASSSSLSSSQANNNNGMMTYGTTYGASNSSNGSNNSSASSSKLSLDAQDGENVTITPNKLAGHEDLRLLAVSTHMTEMSYSISDIQTRIFEIQELRHKSHSSADAIGTTNIIDQSLMNLDERLEALSAGMKSIADSLESLPGGHNGSATPTLQHHEQQQTADTDLLLRKHATLVSEWEAVQEESDVLREELKEDKWLTVFRTVTDQADGMMSSLEKAVNRCQDFIWQVHKRDSGSNTLSHSQSVSALDSLRTPAPLTFDVFNSLLDSFEAKKKHYMPATSKVLSIIDKGVQDRVTKNGETLRRHAESAQRWKNLRERISRTDAEMESCRNILLRGDSAISESGSNTSVGTGKGSARRGKDGKGGYLATPPNGRSRAPSSASTISRSISPFRKFARKLTGGTNGGSSISARQQQQRAPPVTPLTLTKSTRQPASEPAPTLRRQRTSIFSRKQPPQTPSTPDRDGSTIGGGHKYSQSLTPDDSPSTARTLVDLSATASKARQNKQRWNSSTKVEPVEGTATIKGTPPTRRTPSAMGMYGEQPTPSKRSLSRSSMASSRPWTPSSSNATSHSQTSYQRPPPLPILRPPSRIRAQTPSAQAQATLGRAGAATPMSSGIVIPVGTPRARPKTPSHIPAPATKWRSFSGAGSEFSNEDLDPESPTYLARNFSPAFSTSTSGGERYARPPSRSMIPVPSLSFSSASRPGSSMSMSTTSMSNGNGSFGIGHEDESPMTAKFRTFTSGRSGAQTPESALRAKVQSLPFYSPSGSANGKTTSSGGGSAIKQTRPTLQAIKLPPSSFRDNGAPSSIRTPSTSRPSSRSGTYTPIGGLSQSENQFEYTPTSSKDPLDVEVAQIVNAIPHGLLIERVDPPLKVAPKEGVEVRAQYAFSNALARKVVTCRLTTMSRAGGTSSGKKVMCRVGGGWQDLGLYMLNRQAGM